MGLDEIITVGYDASPGAKQALAWAAEEAARREATVRAVACFNAPVMAEPWYVPPAVDIERVRDDTLQYVRAAVAMCQDEHPTVRFEMATRLGPAAPELVDAARGSALLVVGTRGHGRFDGWRLGSVAQWAARHAPCPVAVVPDVEPRPARDRVAVGIDGSADSDAALRWACREAELRDAELLVVHAWDYAYATELGTPEACDLTRLDAALVLEEAVRTARDQRNGPVEGRLVRGRAASQLIEEAIDADLLVVSSRGRGAMRSLLFGSVSNEVSTRAPCPTVIVRGEDADPDS
jgi:nucleotide-binding universal stress UspA family protein